MTPFPLYLPFIVYDDDGIRYAYIPKVADPLIAAGTIFQEFVNGAFRWRIRNRDRSTLQGDHSDLAVCDFCLQRPVTWHIECADFTLPDVSPPWVSTNGWAACEPCGICIESEDRMALLIRATRNRSGALERGMVVVLHDLFWRNYKRCGRIPSSDRLD